MSQRRIAPPLLAAALAAALPLALALAQPATPERSAADPGPPPEGAPVFPDTAAAARDSLMKVVLASIAGRENAPAESVFKDIRVMKGMPAGRVLRIMNVGFGKSLGVGCAHCHVVGEWAKEDRAAKQAARDMWTMVGAINRELLPKVANLQGRPPAVNCTTCHRGATRPALGMP